MLTLYHYWSSVCSQKARLCLAEKGLDWKSRHIDLFTFDHWDPAYVKLNRKAVVPTLDHDGLIVNESNVIIEYLEDVFPEPRLRPQDPYLCARMRHWIYISEEDAHANVNTCSYNLRHRPRLLQKYPMEEVRKLAQRHPNPDLRARMVKRAEIGVSEEEEAAAYRALAAMVDWMEESLAEGCWLVGDAYSLADIAMAPYANRIEVLAHPEILDRSAHPRVADWWERIQARPAFKKAFSFANPDKNDPMKR
jgi:glutathione S-transferase